MLHQGFRRHPLDWQVATSSIVIIFVYISGKSKVSYLDLRKQQEKIMWLYYQKIISFHVQTSNYNFWPRQKKHCHLHLYTVIIGVSSGVLIGSRHQVRGCFAFAWTPNQYVLSAFWTLIRSSITFPVAADKKTTNFWQEQIYVDMIFQKVKLSYLSAVLIDLIIGYFFIYQA